MLSTNFGRRLRAGSALSTAALLALGFAAAPVFAQSASSATDGDTKGEEIVVTGSLFRRTDTATPSPVTVLTAAQLEQRGINTVSEAIQRLSANGAGTLPNSFSANGAFASGASAPSLRGLTTDSTLVLFDGLRGAYYPLADDGTRNFVDINSIPDAIVERIDVLKDGASSTYGADAVAGVINVITKKEIKGLHLNASGGISQKGDSGERRIDATYGHGDLQEDHYNFYVSGEYQKDDMLYSRDRGYPYNTADFSRLCGTSNTTGSTTCRTNGVQNGIQYDGTYAGLGTTTVPTGRAYNSTPITLVDPGGTPHTYAPNTVALTPYAIQGGCGSLPSVGLNATQQRSTTTPYTATRDANGNITGYTFNGQNYTGPVYGATQCQQDNRYLYSVITPEQERIGGSARLTVQLGDSTQAYGEFNYYRSNVYYTGTPQAIRNTTPAGGVAFTTTSIALPVYVCPRNGASATVIAGVPTVPGCSAANGTLNPNNPYASTGGLSRELYYLQDIPLSNRRITDSYRGAAGVSGSVGQLFDYNLDGTYMKQNLRAVYKGYIYVQHLLDEIADGSYNFVNPQANSAAVRNYLAPTLTNKSSSELDQVNLTLKKELFTLPSGKPLNIAIGGSYRHEEVLSPSANPVYPGDKLGTNRYFTINGFGTSGKRNVKSGFFEIDAPIVKMIDVNLSGRYDSYSSGQSHFSPKIGAKFTPVRQFALTGTFSKGFRIPSFAEAYGLPTTGYITQTPPTAYQNSAACTIPGTAQKYSYCTNTYSVGLTSVGNPNLKPETSRNFTVGGLIEPIRNVSFRIDYYDIKKKNLITGADYAPQIAAYYGSGGSTTTLANGITGVTVDPTYITGQGPYPLLNTIIYGFINANSARSRGLDFTFDATKNITPTIKLISSLDATYVIELSQTINGVKQDYAGSLGPYQTTSASGTPRWRGSWQNTLDFNNKVDLTATVYYTSGYSEGAADDGNTPDGQACTASGSFALYRDGATVVRCRVRSFIDVDVSGSVKVTDHLKIYGNVLNLFGAKAPYDPSTYGASNYNPAWANAGVIGRYFRIGAKVDW